VSGDRPVPNMAKGQVFLPTTRQCHSSFALDDYAEKYRREPNPRPHRQL